jgi:folate-binding Fe-S cluster repair protein YgfZ
MQQAFYLLSEDRGVISVAGDDRQPFLQGLVSNDVRRATADRAIYAALLTPQGRYLHDFFIAAIGDTFYLDCEADRRDDLRRRLSLYRLRSKVTLADATDSFAVALLFGQNVLPALGLSSEPGRAVPLEGGCVYVDPRLPEMGARAILPGSTRSNRCSAAPWSWEQPRTMPGCACRSACPMAVATCRSRRRSSSRTASTSFTASIGKKAATWVRS